MEKILIGKIVNAVGLKGEVKVYNYAGSPDRYESLDEVILLKHTAKRDEEETREIENVRYQGNMVILKLKGVNDRNQSEALKNTELYITEDELEELPEDTYYVKDLIGLSVDDEGEYGHIGTLKDVIQSGPQDIYLVKTDAGKEVMIPCVKEFIKEVNVDGGYIKTTLIPGFIGDALELNDGGKSGGAEDED